MQQSSIEWLGRGVWFLIFSIAVITPGVYAAPIIPPPPSIAASSYLLIDAKSKKVFGREEFRPAATASKPDQDHDCLHRRGRD